MKTIQGKIILLTIGMLLLMGSLWIVISYFNQKSIGDYNHILQRYLVLNQALTASQESVQKLNEYILDHTDEHAEAYNLSINQLLTSKSLLSRLTNKENEISLINYGHMIESQIESMNLVMRSIQIGAEEETLDHFKESIQISEYISELTLTLLRKELNSYEKIYLSMIDQSINQNKVGFWAFIMIVLLILFFSFWFSASITRPLGILTQAAKQVASGNFKGKIEVRTKDEIAFLAETFDHMKGNISDLITEIKSKAELEKSLQEYQLLLRESELKSLQTQINPHFLFNTLNTLSKKAYLEGAEETSELVSNVAGLFRYNLSRLDQPVTLKDEIHVVEKYFLILKARFPKRFAYQFDVDESCLEFKLPGMTLQPFIENAFIYAIEPSEVGGQIKVRVVEQDEEIHVHIIDQGPGMSPDKIAEILSEQTPANRANGHSTGIGISNVVRRLSLFYRTNDVIQIESEEGEGTIVTLKLKKLSKGGEENDQDTHSG